MASQSDHRGRFFELARLAVASGRLEKITLGKPRDPASARRKLLVRPVTVRGRPMLSLVWRNATNDITKNHEPPEALHIVELALDADFFDAHLFAGETNAQYTGNETGGALKVMTRPPDALSSSEPDGAAVSHDRKKSYIIPADRPWLRALGVTNEQGRPREGMAPKYRQIQKFAELLDGLLDETFPRDATLHIEDMGSGKGYLTFALADLLGARGNVRGIEARRELVDLGNRVAAEIGLASRLHFEAGDIADAAAAPADVLMALHACDTATDDALARGIAAGAKLLVVSPCCQKELRPQLSAPPVLAPALRHGIFQERQAEFVTDALRAQLLEWCGFRTKVFEFISTEHTAKNLMIAAVKTREAGDPAIASGIRALAKFYGIRHQHLASRLGFDLTENVGPTVSPEAI